MCFIQTKLSVVFLLICASKLGVGQGPAQSFVAKSNAKLTSDLLQEISASKQGNIVFSPSSILVGLGMLYAATDGKTRTAAAKSLEFPENDEEFFKGIKSVSRPSTMGLDNKTLYTANMITVNKGIGIKTSYGSAIVKEFQGNLFTEDFTSGSDRDRRNINIWVARRTNQKIPNLLPPGTIKPTTNVVLVNALYFKDEWFSQFDELDTAGEDFTTDDGQTLKTEMMEKDLQVLYKEFSGFEVVSLPFANGDFHWVAVLPSRDGNVEQVLNQLEAAGMMEAITNPEENMDNTFALLKIPKFQSEMRIELKSILQNIPGLADMLVKGADLSRMTNSPVEVDNINHMAIIDVRESGVEAAAATSISVVPYANFQPELSITLDRPFMYFIVEGPKRMVHIAGILKSPKPVQ